MQLRWEALKRRRLIVCEDPSKSGLFCDQVPNSICVANGCVRWECRSQREWCVNRSLCWIFQIRLSQSSFMRAWDCFRDTICGVVCRDSNRNRLHVVERAHMIQKKILPETPVGGRLIQWVEASRAEAKVDHEIEQKGVFSRTKSHRWDVKLQCMKRWSIVFVPPGRTNGVNWNTPLD